MAVPNRPVLNDELHLRGDRPSAARDHLLIFSYLYDNAGRPVSLTNPYNETSQWAYGDNGWLQSQRLGNGVATAYTYNPAGQLLDLKTSTATQALLSEYGAQNGIHYDGAGNRTSTNCNMPGSPAATGNSTYQYNGRDELQQEVSTQNGGYSNNFASDAALNLTTFRGQSAVYNANNQNVAFTYDSNGNPTSYKGINVAWDPANRMTAYGGALTAGYTGAGLRAWKQNSQGQRTYFAGPLELDGQGNVIAVNTFGPTGLLSRRTPAGSVFYTFDPHGNLAQRLDASGNVVSSSVFDAFGNKLSTEAQTDPWGYGAQAGYYTDVETGLILCTHRYYDPTQGRWLNGDPIGYVGGLNLYAYVGNGPGRAIDPTGFQGIGGDENNPRIIGPPPITNTNPEIEEEKKGLQRECPGMDVGAIINPPGQSSPSSAGSGSQAVSPGSGGGGGVGSGGGGGGTVRLFRLCGADEAQKVADTGELQPSNNRITGVHTRMFDDSQYERMLGDFGTKDTANPGSYSCLIVGDFISDFLGQNFGYDHLHEHGWIEQPGIFNIDWPRINDCKVTTPIVMKL